MQVIIPELVKTLGVEAIKLLPTLFKKLTKKKESSTPDLNAEDIEKIVDSTAKAEGIMLDSASKNQLVEASGDLLDSASSSDVTESVIEALTRAGVKLTDPIINEVADAIENLVSTPSERSRGIGSSCSQHKQCAKSGFPGSEFAGITDQVGCCKNEFGIPTCSFKKYDWLGVAYCPTECVGSIFGKPDTCTKDVEQKSKYEDLQNLYMKSEYSIGKQKVIDPNELANIRAKRNYASAQAKRTKESEIEQKKAFIASEAEKRKSLLEAKQLERAEMIRMKQEEAEERKAILEARQLERAEQLRAKQEEAEERKFARYLEEEDIEIRRRGKKGERAPQPSWEQSNIDYMLPEASHAASDVGMVQMISNAGNEEYIQPSRVERIREVGMTGVL